MKVALSPFLLAQKESLKQIIADLSKEFSYVSILGADTKGKSYGVKITGASISDSPWSERGFVLRVYNGINYSEYSFNVVDVAQVKEKIRQIAKRDVETLKQQGAHIRTYPVILEEEITQSFQGEVLSLPQEMKAKEKIACMRDMVEMGMKGLDALIDFRIQYEEVWISKIFLSNHKDLAQSYIYTTGAIVPIARNEKGVKYTFKAFSGLKGTEIFEEMKKAISQAIQDVKDLLKAERMVPGEYEIICDPDVSGLIAHEAFGHGVEMDMFVKNRAKAQEYMNRRVASDVTQMHDGAKSAVEVSSYLFDDEGTLGTDTKIIENGILKSGICDALSALSLGVKPTGNGKRESFERKAYTRMTNTFFEAGKDNLADMIASIDHGYLLEGFQSGMEDPKNWGIQCVIAKGKEIKEGKLTGKIVSPIYLTGYVPDLLQSISMVSDGLKLSGSGACGKGHKEWVKTSTGGSYIKAVGRLS